jgi:hypothetical protein
MEVPAVAMAANTGSRSRTSITRVRPVREDEGEQEDDDEGGETQNECHPHDAYVEPRDEYAYGSELQQGVSTLTRQSHEP